MLLSLLYIILHLLILRLNNLCFEQWSENGIKCFRQMMTECAVPNPEIEHFLKSQDVEASTISFVCNIGLNWNRDSAVFADLLQKYNLLKQVRKRTTALRSTVYTSLPAAKENVKGQLIGLSNARLPTFASHFPPQEFFDVLQNRKTVNMLSRLILTIYRFRL